MMNNPVSEQRRLTGRSIELDQLSQIVRGLKSGRGRIVFLTGAPGVGKTALAQAFLQEMKAADPRAIALFARCVEGQTAHRPYGPLRDLLAGLSRTGGPEVAHLVSQKAPQWSGGNGPAAGRLALFDQYLSVWRAVTEQRSVAALVDDLQWSDRSSLDLLTHIGISLSSLPVLLLVTFEAVGREGAVSLSGVRGRIGTSGVEVAVRPLKDDEIEELVEGLLGGPPGRDLFESVVQGALGSPLYAEQVVRSLRERNLIRKRLFRYAVKEEDLPQGAGKIKEVIRERLDALDPNVRWALEGASFSGSVIDSRVVAGQVGKAESEVLTQLRAADEAYGLVERSGDHRWADGRRSLRFVFRSPLVRQVLRARAPAKRQGRLVHRAAQALEQLAGDGARMIADELTALYMYTGDEPQTHKWSLAAADLGEHLYAPYETEQFLRLAARTTQDDLERTRIEHRLATVYAATGREREAEKLLEVIFERCNELDDRAMEARAGALLGWLQLERGVQSSTLSALTGKLVDSARQSGVPEALVTATDLACVVAEQVGRAEEALMMGEEALHVADQSGNSELVGQAAYRLARVHISWGSPQEGRALAERALEVFRELEADRGVTECHDILGLADFRAGDWDSALHHWSSALKALEERSAPEQKIAMQLNIAELATLRGDFQRAIELFESGRELAEKLKDEALALRCRIGLTRTEFERGDYAVALELSDQIRKILPEGGAWREDFQTTAIRALSHLELGDELQAWQEAARLEQLYQGKEGWFARRAEGDAVRIRVIDLDSDAWLAGMVAQQGIGETADKDPYGEGFLQYHQACVQARSNPAEARQAAERAVELFSKLGAQPMLDRAKRLLAELPAAAAKVEEADEEELTDEKLDKWFDSIDG